METAALVAPITGLELFQDRFLTGKDGCVRIFRTQHEDGEFRLEGLRVQRACRGMEWLERARFVIAGFHAVHFVVWDPVRQERLMAVACGGGHRSWSLWPSHTGVWPGRGALVFIKQGAVLTSQPPGEMLGCAGDAGRTGGWSLREGIHGRGIWCVCRLGRIEETGIDSHARTGSSKSYWEVVVTGGEDTSLAVLAINSVSGIIKVLSVLTDHISGVRTATAITRPQGDTLSSLVLSAGGRAQIQCNRLLVAWDRQRLAPYCQVIQVASHRLDAQWEKKRNRHKTVKMDPEIKPTNYLYKLWLFSCFTQFLLLFCCYFSRLFSVNEGENQIDLLWETFYHQRCVLCVATCSLQDDKGNRSRLLLSAATDGNIAVWRLTESLSIPAQNSIPCLVIPAHQSGINSLAVWVEILGQQEDGCLVTVASGGDDGQLTVSTVRAQHPEDGDDDHAAQDNPSNQFQLRFHSQFSIPLAHAASLTALKLLSPGLLVSTSSDQRVCLWRVSGTDISHNGAFQLRNLLSMPVDPSEQHRCVIRLLLKNV
uniref:tRNA (34-2'-O)-methyltransferase regulator WDR6 n=1 Tax=Xiphophorus couchianus TaxID=32473 RepID=A0A3B5L1G6_9TELE